MSAADSLPDYVVTTDPAAVDWRRIAEIVRTAPLADRRPEDHARAFANSFAAAFAWHGALLVGCARMVSDGVVYATIFDVCVAPGHQGRGAGRAMMERLLAAAPFEKVFLTAVPGREGFYAKLGFLRQTNAMGFYASAARARAIAHGILVDDRPAAVAGTASAAVCSRPQDEGEPACT